MLSGSGVVVVVVVEVEAGVVVCGPVKAFTLMSLVPSAHSENDFLHISLTLSLFLSLFFYSPLLFHLIPLSSSLYNLLLLLSIYIYIKLHTVIHIYICIHIYYICFDFYSWDILNC